MTEAVSRTLVALTVGFQFSIVQHPVELLFMILWKHRIGRLGFVTLCRPLKRVDSTRGALAVAKSAFDANLDQEDSDQFEER